MIAQILVPQRQGVDTLTHQRVRIVDIALATVTVYQRRGHRLGQTQILIGLAQRQ